VSEPELRPAEVTWDGITLESSDEEGDPNKASDGTSVSERSRRSEDTENPHWSSWWGGWGFTEAYLEDRRSYYDDIMMVKPSPWTMSLMCA
jgi:hypothetical protein